jgi:hypothetical protein
MVKDYGSEDLEEIFTNSEYCIKLDLICKSITIFALTRINQEMIFHMFFSLGALTVFQRRRINPKSSRIDRNFLRL